MRSAGVMVVTSNRYGYHPLSNRSNKNSEYSEMAGATLRDNGGDTGFMPKYLLEEVGRCLKAGIEIDAIVWFISNSGKTNREMAEWFKMSRTKKDATEADLRETRKVTLLSDAWKVIDHMADQTGVSVSEIINRTMLEYTAKIMEGTSK